LLQEKQTKEGGSTVDVEILYERCLIGQFGNILYYYIPLNNSQRSAFHRHHHLFVIFEFSPFYRPDHIIDFLLQHTPEFRLQGLRIRSRLPKIMRIRIRNPDNKKGCAELTMAVILL
jgi:hypothetical protein